MLKMHCPRASLSLKLRPALKTASGQSFVKAAWRSSLKRKLRLSESHAGKTEFMHGFTSLTAAFSPSSLRQKRIDHGQLSKALAMLHVF